MTDQNDGAEELKLHDDTIQMLFAISLRVEYCLEVIDELPTQARADLEQVVSDLNELMFSLRERIDDLK